MKNKILILLMLFSFLILVGCNFGTNNPSEGDDPTKQEGIYNDSINDEEAYQKWLESIKGVDGREIELSVVDNMVVWRYSDSVSWTPLFTLENIDGVDGKDGVDGADGVDGREVELRIFNGAIQWKYTVDASWNDLFSLDQVKGDAGDNGIGIAKIEKAKTEGLVDTYSITYTDGTMTTFTVTNGKGEKGDPGEQGPVGPEGPQGPQGDRGSGIDKIVLTKTEGLIDTYTIYFEDGSTSEFTIKNGDKGEQGDQGEQGIQGAQGEQGVSIVNIELTDSPSLYIDIYTIYFSDGTSTTFEIRHGLPIDERQYKVSFDSQGGSEIDSQYIKFGYKVNKPMDPTKDGYNFVGWFVGEEQWSFIGYFITQNTQLTAKWEEAEYVINYELNGGENNELNPLNYTISSEDLELLDPTKYGYQFDGWYSDANFLNPVDKIETGSFGDKKLYAKWTPNQHKVKFETNGGTLVDEITVNFGEKITLPETQRNGYTFLFWSAEENMYTEIKDLTMPDNDLTLYARWASDGESIYTVKVYLQQFDGSYSIIPDYINTYVEKIEQKVTAPMNYYEGYEYPNYNPSGVVVPDGSLTFNLYYTLRTYHIYVDGDNQKTYSFKYGEEISIPNPSRTGYTFVGYGREVPETMPNYDIWLYPQWQADVYDIEFDANGGNLTVTTAQYLYGQSVTLPVPTADGFQFAGWYYGDKKVNDGLWNIAKSVTLKARWATKFEDLVFEQNEGSLTLIGYNGTDATEVVVPNNVEGLNVVKVADGVFANNEVIERVIFLSGIKEIGEGVFTNCINLKEVSFPSTVETFNKNILLDCSAIEKITIASNVNFEIKYLFGNNINNVPESLVKIKYADGCSDINKTMWNTATIKLSGERVVLELADDMTYVPSYAFQNCYYLTDVIIPEGYLYIEYDSFYYCNNLLTVQFSNTIETIQSDSFAYCSKLQKAELPENLLRLNWGAFRGCYELKEVIFNEKLEYIEGYAFENCNKLSNVMLPNSIINMADNVFVNCYNTIIFSALKETPTNWSSNWNGSATVVWDYKELIELDEIEYAITNDNRAIPVRVLNPEKTIYNFIDAFEDYEISSISLYSLFNNNEFVEEVYIPASYNGAISSNSFENCNNLKKVIFEENSQVSKIDSYAFSNCSMLEEIIIPKTVELINDRAFNNCTSLVNVTFEEGSLLTLIGESAFYGCSSLQSFVVPSKVITINGYAFRQCTSLESVTFEEGSLLTSISFHAFSNCSSLQSFVVPSNVTTINSNTFQQCTSLESVTFEEGSLLTSIGSDAFSSCSSLQSFNVPFGVTRIDHYAFGNCSNLKKLVIPATVVTIDNQILYSNNNIMILCEVSEKPNGWTSNWHGSNESRVHWSATDVLENDDYTYIINSNNMEASIIKIKEISETVDIPSTIDDYTVVALGASLFNDSNVVEVNIPDTVTKINAYTFYSCNNLITVNGENIKHVDNYAFYDCTSLSDVSWLNGLKTIGAYAFHNCYNLATSIIFTELESIGAEAFENNQTLKMVYFPEATKTLENYVFEQMYDLNIYTSYAAAPTGWASAWNNCNANVTWGVKGLLEDNIFAYVVQEDDTAKAITLLDKSINEIEIPETIGNYSITSLASGLIDYNNSVNKIFIPETIIYIAAGAFVNKMEGLTIYCQVEEALEGWEDGWNNSGSTIYNVLRYDQNDEFEYVVKNDETIEITRLIKLTKVIEIPEEIDGMTVTTLSSRLIDPMHPAVGVEEIHIPETIEFIKGGAFSSQEMISIYCKAKEQPEGWDDNWYYNCAVIFDVIEINQNGAFKYVVMSTGVHILNALSDSLVSLTIPDTINDLPVVSIQDGLFKNNTSLVEVVLPDTIEVIGSYTFDNCINLKTVTAKGVKVIKEYAFNYCQDLITLNLGEVYEVGNYALYCCHNLKNAKWLDGIKTIGSSALYQCYNIAKEIIFSQVESIGEYALYDIDNLNIVFIPNTCNEISNYAFQSCDSLTIYTKFAEQQDNWNYNWNGNRSVNYNTLVGKNDNFSYIINEDNTAKILSIVDKEASEVIIPAEIDGATVTEISERLFYNNKKILTVTLPDTINTIPDYAFYQCEYLQTVNGKGIEHVGYYAFYNCYKVSNLDWLDNLKTIGERAFYNCRNLAESIRFSQLEFIDQYALYSISSLKKLFINKGAILSNYAVYECHSVTIYCEDETQPELWDSSWNPNGRSVIWGCIDEFENDNYTGVIKTDNTIHISSSQNITQKTLVIDEIDGYTVSSIGVNAFYDNNYIKELFIGDSVKVIEDSAFYSCDNLRFVYLGSSVEKIGDHAFADINYLKKINLPSSISVIENYAFSSSYNCEFYIEGSTYGDYWQYSWNENTYRYERFNSNEWVNDVDNKYIYYLDSDGNKFLVYYYGDETKVTIDDDIYGITKNTFVNTDITKLIIPNTVEVIEQYALYENYKMNLCICSSSIKENWNNNYYNSCNSVYYGYNPSLERGALTIKSTSYETEYTGNWINCNNVSSLEYGELQEGDYVSGYVYHNEYINVGTYTINFNYTIYDSAGRDVTHYYDVTIEYGTLTIK